MLSLVTQDGLRKVEVTSYEILEDKLSSYVITNKGLILGEYKNKDLAHKVFLDMIEAEEKQENLRHSFSKKHNPKEQETNQFDSRFFIYEMPADELDDDEDRFDEINKSEKKFNLLLKVFHKTKKNI